MIQQNGTQTTRFHPVFGPIKHTAAILVPVWDKLHNQHVREKKAKGSNEQASPQYMYVCMYKLMYTSLI